MVTTDTEQTITGKKVFGTLQAASLTDGTTTKTMTEVLNKQDKLTAGNNITISEDNVISATVPENVVTTDTEQEITGKKTLKSTNPYYWAEIGVIDDKDVPGISFKDQYSKVNVYRDGNGIMQIETPTYGTQVQIKNVLIDGKGDGSNIIRSISQSNKLYLGDATRPISTLYAKNLSDKASRQKKGPQESEMSLCCKSLSE